jgi:hypothetical protein
LNDCSTPDDWKTATIFKVSVDKTSFSRGEIDSVEADAIAKWILWALANDENVSQHI